MPIYKSLRFHSLFYVYDLKNGIRRGSYIADKSKESTLKACKNFYGGKKQNQLSKMQKLV